MSQRWGYLQVFRGRVQLVTLYPALGVVAFGVKVPWQTSMAWREYHCWTLISFVSLLVISSLMRESSARLELTADPTAAVVPAHSLPKASPRGPQDVGEGLHPPLVGVGMRFWPSVEVFSKRMW